MSEWSWINDKQNGVMSQPSGPRVYSRQVREIVKVMEMESVVWVGERRV